MINVKNGKVTFQGKMVDILAETTCVLRACRKLVEDASGEEVANEMIKHAYDNAMKSDDEIKTLAKDHLKKLIHDILEDDDEEPEEEDQEADDIPSDEDILKMLKKIFG